MTNPTAESALTRAQLAELIDPRWHDVVIPRTAAKPWRCTAAAETLAPGRPNPNYRPDCLGDIPVGTGHLEYVGEAAAYESGTRYCARCCVAVWGRKPS